jgi:hypothetical protein
MTQQCQNILESDGETRCPEPATYFVHGLPPDNFWSGYHCTEHTKNMVDHYDHQGGLVIRTIDSPGAEKVQTLVRKGIV